MCDYFSSMIFVFLTDHLTVFCFFTVYWRLLFFCLFFRLMSYINKSFYIIADAIIYYEVFSVGYAVQSGFTFLPKAYLSHFQSEPFQPYSSKLYTIIAYFILSRLCFNVKCEFSVNISKNVGKIKAFSVVLYIEGDFEVCFRAKEKIYHTQILFGNYHNFIFCFSIIKDIKNRGPPLISFFKS